MSRPSRRTPRTSPPPTPPPCCGTPCRKPRAASVRRTIRPPLRHLRITKSAPPDPPAGRTRPDSKMHRPAATPAPRESASEHLQSDASAGPSAPRGRCHPSVCPRRRQKPPPHTRPPDLPGNPFPHPLRALRGGSCCPPTRSTETPAKRSPPAGQSVSDPPAAVARQASTWCTSCTAMSPASRGIASHAFWSSVACVSR